MERLGYLTSFSIYKSFTFDLIATIVIPLYLFSPTKIPD